MNFTIPPWLKKGDKIGITATARKIMPDQLTFALQTFKDWGLEVVLGKTIGKESHQLAGTPVERAEDFNQMLADNEIKAIFCAKGGFGTLQMIDLINFELLKKNPKWICGFSDITALHCHINKNLTMASLHSLMPGQLDGKPDRLPSINSMYDALFGKFEKYVIENDENNRNGETKGILCGGNLSVLYALAGSTSEPDYKGKILFIEEIDEYLYHIDRMITSLKRAGKLSNLAGLIVGNMTDMKDHDIPFGQTAYEIISSHITEYDFPVVYGFPAGHENKNLALITGMSYKLHVSEMNGISKIELSVVSGQ